MLLKESHIAAWQINWNDKAMNLRQIALDLNIGTDSMVFVDDSEFEINLIREVMPEVTTIHLPEKTATRYRQILSSFGLFDTITVSEEDKKRGAMYKAEAGRKARRMAEEEGRTQAGAVGHCRRIDPETAQAIHPIA